MRRLYIYLATSIRKLGFPGGSDGKESACKAGDSGLFLGWKDPLEKGMATHSSIPAWRILWTEDLHEVAKSLTRLSD